MNEPIDFLRKYKRKYGKFKVAVQLQDYWKHFKYPSPEFYDFFSCAHGLQPGHRIIFKDEVIIEGDLPNRKTNLKNTQWISKRLDGLKLSYKKYYSGNKSYHYHLIFPELMKFNDEECSHLKERIIRYIFLCPSGSKFCNRCSIETCNVVVMGVDMQLTKNHLVRVEYGIHSKTDKRKILLQEGKHGKNLIPELCKAKIKGIKHFANDECVHRPVYSTMNCIKFLQSAKAFEKITDARERVMFVLAKQHKQLGKSENETYSAMLAWNNAVVNGHFIEQKVRATVKSAYSSERVPGCPYIRNILKDLRRVDVCEGCYKNKEAR